jgi:enoyl-CoA hydratase/carnithine racemase
MEHIITTIEAGIAAIRLNRPEVLNALNRAVVDEIDGFLDEIIDREDVRVLLLYGSGNFAAGADIKGMVDCGEEEACKFSFSPTYNKLENLPIPSIAAIEGYALGGGLELALACDLRIAEPVSKLGFPEINLGIMPGAGGTIRTPRLIGEARAKDLILTGEIISGEHACKIGLVNRLAPEGEVFQEALKLAERLSHKAPVALKTAKKTIREGQQEPCLSAAIDLEAESWAALFRTEDQKEGMRAFLEKRKPAYRGK